MNLYDFTCEFIRIDNDEYRCKNCGMKISYKGLEKPIMLCLQKIKNNDPEQFGIRVLSTETQDRKVEEIPTEPPSLMQRVINFSKAAASHAMAGNPKCTDAQIQERYDICKTCEFFKNNICTKCGCSLVREKIYMNKLAWADQSCPVGKWGPIK